MIKINCNCGRNEWSEIVDNKTTANCCGIMIDYNNNQIIDDCPVNNPKHYNSHPSGIECIEVVRWFCFNIGNAIKYLWRAGLKGDDIEDLKKARWYIDDEIKKRISRTEKENTIDP